MLLLMGEVTLIILKHAVFTSTVIVVTQLVKIIRTY